MYQNGPGLNGRAQSQSKEISELGSTKPDDVPKTLSGTEMVRNWGWEPVLKGGLVTKVGMVVDHTITTKSNPVYDKWHWRFAVLEEGQYPSYP